MLHMGDTQICEVKTTPASAHTQTEQAQEPI